MYPPIDKLLPHDHPMILIDKIIDSTETQIISETRISCNSLFYEDTEQGIPAYLSIEMMAQTIAAKAGLNAVSASQPVPVGLLLGCRRYQLYQSYLRLKSRVIIHADQVMYDDTMAVYQCKMLMDNAELATAQINTFVPNDQQLKELLTLNERK